MKLQTADYLVIAGFFLVNIAIGVYYARRGGRSLGEFFLSGRNVPWWLAGTSMVATTFAADTPLAVTGFVVNNGVAGNWLWWNMVMSGMLTVFFFAALWRRSGILTDVEFIELRYGGAPASALRGVRAVYQGVIINSIIMGWVNLAMGKILNLTLGIPKAEAVAICLVLTAVYVAIGGLWSVLVTDLLQFVLKMTMVVVLAVVAVGAVGGIAVMRTHLAALDALHHVASGGSILAFFPTSNSAWMPLTSFIVFVSVAWWASSYPGAEPGGGGYIAQRIFASKDEKNATWATLFFNVAHYALRPWPWILVALASLILYPHGVADPTTHKIDPELNYIQTMIDYLPAWLRGLMMAGFLAAYMSTIGTQLNLGASYLTNDLYRRFLRPGAGERELVWASRLSTIVAMLLAAVATAFMTSVGAAWAYVLTFTAGVGLVMILRWYWWRVNAWSEISALACSGIVASILQYVLRADADTPSRTTTILLITVPITTLVWLVVTFATKPESAETLERFFRRVRPAGMGWAPVAARLGLQNEGRGLGLNVLDWIAGCGMVYFTLFGIGKVVLAEFTTGIVLLVLAAFCAAFVLWDVNRRAPARPESRGVAAATALLLLVVLVPGSARAVATDKQLDNLHGNVTYVVHSTGSRHDLAQAASIVLGDDDVAQTAAASMAAIDLPDSSRVVMGSNTAVKLDFFNQAEVASAHFILFEGKTRFKVEHPQGARANYTFDTPTGQIAVRGTDGDISVDFEDGVRVNVYHTSDPGAPVHVTMINGKTFDIPAGQKLWMRWDKGTLDGVQTSLTRSEIARFSEFGPPAVIDGGFPKQ
ncbi:MAG: FecR domain-containing protein [Candidatus Eremiobacteraeota bacterium]|nr:FecR domain-containing protein [Candidatus Eremiobacteraeota bacterium]